MGLRCLASEGFKSYLICTKWLPVVAVVLISGFGRASGQTETVLYSFLGSSSDGGNPWAPLVQGSGGNFYGTAVGGHYPYSTNDYGCVFRISPSGSFTNIHSFRNSDGAYPFAGLVQGNDGNFYGTTALGGNTNLNHGDGFGTVFRIGPSGILTSLYSFGNYAVDGTEPFAGLVQGSDGNFYGTTHLGGTSTNCSGAGCGTVFRISPTGNYTNLYSFTGYPNDGSSPNGLVQGSDANFYGTASFGGTNNGGAVFRITPSGTYTTLYSFIGITDFGNGDGAQPSAGLVRGSDGNLYGTTSVGGVFSFQNDAGYGTVFRISPSGIYTSIYSFNGPPTDGGFPVAPLVQGSDGNFYGTTQSGGSSGNCSHGCGIIFRITPNGTETNLYSFDNVAGDGVEPNVALVQGSDGNFYSITTYGGIGGFNGSGTVYRLSVPLNPPANQISGVRPSGSDIVFNIPSVAGEAYQLQFSPSMNPTNWSDVSGVSIINSIGALLTLTNFGGATGPQGFYRFAITP